MRHKKMQFDAIGQ
jgi:membrane-associated HD superfamily phosphohydrolase